MPPRDIPPEFFLKNKSIHRFEVAQLVWSLQCRVESEFFINKFPQPAERGVNDPHILRLRILGPVICDNQPIKILVVTTRLKEQRKIIVEPPEIRNDETALSHIAYFQTRTYNI